MAMYISEYMNMFNIHNTLIYISRFPGEWRKPGAPSGTDVRLARHGITDGGTGNCRWSHLKGYFERLTPFWIGFIFEIPFQAIQKTSCQGLISGRHHCPFELGLYAVQFANFKLLLTASFMSYCNCQTRLMFSGQSFKQVRLAHIV